MQVLSILYFTFTDCIFRLFMNYQNKTTCQPGLFSMCDQRKYCLYSWCISESQNSLVSNAMQYRITQFRVQMLLWNRFMQPAKIGMLT